MKLHQITEDDLAELERTIPQFADRLMTQMDNRLRVQIRRTREILADVRWNYGPPREVQTIPTPGDAKA
jgi:hypothetical protein